MRAVALLVTVVTAMSVAFVAAAPADAAKKRSKRAVAAQAAPANPNEASGRLVVDALPVFLPGGGLWASHQEKSKPVARKKKRR